MLERTIPAAPKGALAGPLHGQAGGSSGRPLPPAGGTCLGKGKQVEAQTFGTITRIGQRKLQGESETKRQGSAKLNNTGHEQIKTRCWGKLTQTKKETPNQHHVFQDRKGAKRNMEILSCSALVGRKLGAHVSGPRNHLFSDVIILVLLWPDEHLRRPGVVRETALHASLGGEENRREGYGGGDKAGRRRRRCAPEVCARHGRH